MAFRTRQTLGQRQKSEHASVRPWILGIELNGEWEQCTFGTRQEAITAFAALSSDYDAQIERAVLFRDPGEQERQSLANMGTPIARNYIH